MTQEQLIRQLRKLREVEPSHDWVIFTKKRIFAQDLEVKKSPGLLSFLPLFRYKLAFAPIVSVLIIIGLFGFAENTVPGDLLFSVKQMAETAQVAFSSQIEKPKTQLMLVNKRLEELSRIAEDNLVRNLDPAIKAFQASIAQATKDLIEMESTGSEDPMIIKEIVAETQKMTENKQKVESVLGTIIGDTEELDNAISQLKRQTASYLIADLSQRTLSEENAELLNEAKQEFEEGDYDKALEKMWLLSNK